ncbi:MAG: ribbon-helix-helix protein, CopG family [Betaproteobacteria bacterium]
MAGGRKRSGPREAKPASREKAAITVRLPREDYEGLRELAEARGVSLSLLAAEALTQYQAGEERRQLLKEIDAFRKGLKERHGVGKDSVALIRRMRLERVAHLGGENEPEDGKDEP